MKTMNYLMSVFIINFLFLTINSFSQNLNYKATSTEIDTLYYLPDSASFISQYSIAGEIYDIFTRFDVPNNWTSYKIKEVHFLFSEMVKGNTLREVKFFKDTLKTLIYTQSVNEVLDSMDIYPNWYKLTIVENMPLITETVEIPVYIIDVFSLCITHQSFSSGNTLGFYESTQNWGITSDYPIKLVIEKTTTDVEEEDNLINKYSLSQNYPNPLNPNTKIKFSIPSGVVDEYIRPLHNVTLIVYNILGNEVATLVNEPKQPGIYEVEWNAGGFSSGVYFYRLISGSFTETKKMILLR